MWSIAHRKVPVTGYPSPGPHRAIRRTAARRPAASIDKPQEMSPLSKIHEPTPVVHRRTYGAQRLRPRMWPPAADAAGLPGTTRGAGRTTSAALRHVEGTASAKLGADRPEWRFESQAFQADCAGSSPVTRSTAVSRCRGVAGTRSQVSRDTAHVRAVCGAAMTLVLPADDSLHQTRRGTAGRVRSSGAASATS